MNGIAEKIIISTDFTDAPGARYKTDGAKSGEEFYELILKSKYEAALAKKGKLFIDLDNTWGYASSFISETFGRLAREYGQENVLKNLELKSEDEPLLIDKIKHIIKTQGTN